MLKMRKFAAAVVLSLAMCLALFTTGAFAQNAFIGQTASATAVAVATGGNGFFGPCGFGGGLFGGGFFGGGLFDGGLFGGGSAIAISHASAGGWW